MDTQDAAFIPIFALAIPVAGIIFHGLAEVAKLRIEVKSGVEASR